MMSRCKQHVRAADLGLPRGRCAWSRGGGPPTGWPAGVPPPPGISAHTPAALLCWFSLSSCFLCPPLRVLRAASTQPARTLPLRAHGRGSAGARSRLPDSLGAAAVVSRTDAGPRVRHLRAFLGTCQCVTASEPAWLWIPSARSTSGTHPMPDFPALPDRVPVAWTPERCCPASDSVPQGAGFERRPQASGVRDRGRGRGLHVCGGCWQPLWARRLRGGMG